MSRVVLSWGCSNAGLALKILIEPKFSSVVNLMCFDLGCDVMQAVL